MKKSLLVASLLLVGTSALASVEPFIGVNVGKASWTPEAKISLNGTQVGTTSEKDSGSMLSIGGGVIIDDTHKLGLGYSTYNTDADVSMHSIDLGYAYLFNQSDLGITNKNWKPFIALSYTMNSYTEDLDSNWNKSKFELDTKALLLGLGTDYKINEKSFLTMGYDFSLSTSGSESAILSEGGDDYDVTMEVDKMSRFYFGYNYKF